MDALDPARYELVATAEYPEILYALCFDTAGGTLYVAGDDRSVYSLDVTADKRAEAKPKDKQAGDEKPAEQKPAEQKPADKKPGGAKGKDRKPEPAKLELQQRWTHHENYVSALVSRGEQVISAGYDGRIVWTLAGSGERQREIAAHDGWIRDLALFPDGDRLASVGHDMLVKLFSAVTGKLLHACAGHAPHTPQGYVSAIYAVAVSPDGRHVASGDRVGEIRIWEADSGKQAAVLQSPAFYTYDPTKRIRSIGGIRSLCFSPDGKHLAVSGIGQVTNVDGFVGPCRVEVWDWQSGKKVFTGQDPHNAVLNHVAYDASGKWLLAAGGGDSGGLLAFWDQSSEKPQHKAKPKGHIQRFHLDEPSRAIYMAGHGGVQIWREQTAPSKPD